VGDRATAGLLGLLLFVSYAYFVSPPSWNENSRFDLVRSLVERQRLDIDPYEHDTGDKSFRQGHTYSDKAPGASFLAVPAYAAYYGFRRLTGSSQASSLPAAGHREEGELPYLVNTAFRRALYVCNLSTNALAGALLGAAFLALLRRRFGVPARSALATALSLGLGSLVFPYATMFYGHVLAALFLFVAFALVTRRETVPGRHLAAAGAAAGLAVLTELPAAPVAVLLGVCAVTLVRPRRQALWYVAGGSGPLLLLLGYQYAAFGAALRSGYALVSRPEFAAGMSHGVMGVGVPRPGVLFAELFGRARGLLYLSPVLLLGFVGLSRRLVAVWADRRARAEVAVASGVVVYFLLMNAGYYMWYGGSALGPRHVIPALPFLSLGIPFAFRRPRPVLVGALIAVSIVNQLAATAVQPTAPLVRDVLLDHVYPHLLRGEVPSPAGPSNLGTLLGLPGPASLIPLILLWALALPMLVTRPPAPIATDLGSP
jgi:hypothetical protein